MPFPPSGDTIVTLTGAGISKESGLDTFRDKSGIWSTVRPEDVATPEGFDRDPARVHAFYNASLPHDARPGPASELVPALVERLMHSQDA